MREITKEVKHEVEGKEFIFQITKMNALKGTYLVKFVTEKLIPVFTQLQGIFQAPDKDADGKDLSEEEQQKIVEQRTEEVLQMIPKALEALSEEELTGLIERCLQTVQVMMPAGWQPVMIGHNFGVEELEYDIMTTLLLCYEVIEFNLGSFFGGKSLGSFLPRRNTSK